jgi:hypothetical protein
MPRTPSKLGYSYFSLLFRYSITDPQSVTEVFMFYKISWNAQLASAIALFITSFYFEASVLLAYISIPLVAIVTAGALECSKVLTIILYRYFRTQQDAVYPFTVAFWTTVFRSGLIVFSLIATVMFFAASFDRPRIESVRQHDLSELQTNYQQQQARLDQEVQRLYNDTLPALQERYQAQREHENANHINSLGALQSLLTEEMDNVVNGRFIGRRYQALEARLSEERSSFSSRQMQNNQAHEQVVEKLRDETEQRITTERAELHANFQARAEQVKSAQYLQDDRVNHPVTVAAVRMVNHLSPWEISIIHLSLVFAILLSLLLELGILVTFEHITITYLPIFAAQVKGEQSLRTRKAEVAAELKEYELRDLPAVNKVKHWLKQLGGESAL